MSSTPRLICILFACFALLGCGGRRKPPQPAAEAPAASAPQAEDDSFRMTPPTPMAPAPLVAPVPTQTVLANGLSVYTVHKSGLPVVHASVVVQSGSAHDPRGQEGLAGFLGDMLEMGTERLSAPELAEAIEALGTEISIGVQEDATALGTSVLEENFEGALALLAEMVQKPRLAPAEINRVRKQRATSLAQDADSPPQAAQNAFRKLVYGNHPYAHNSLGTPGFLARVQRPALHRHYKTHFRPANAALIVVGSLSEADALALAERHFGGWRGAPGAGPKLAPVAERAPEVALIPRPDASQSELLLGHLGVSRADPDYFPLFLCSAILGGAFNSRINMNLREDKGYTYGARAMFDFARQRGSFLVSTGVRTDATEPAIREIIKEVAAIRDADVSAEELASAKARYTASLPGNFQTVAKISAMVAQIYMYGLPRDYYQRLPEALGAVSIADIRRVAQRHLHPERLSVVVVGDRTQISSGLAKLNRGPVRLRGVDGSPQ